MTTTAWDLIGDEGEFRIVGGRAIYTDAMYVATEGSVKLAYLKATNRGLHQVNRYVHPDTPIEVMRNYTKEQETAREAELAELKEIYG